MRFRLYISHFENQASNERVKRMKKLALKIGLLLLVVAPAQMLIGPLIVSRERGMESIRKLERYLDDDTDVIFFSDSVNRSFARDDTKKKAVSENLQEKLPEYSVGSVDEYAFQMDVYLHFFRYIINHEKRPRAIVVPINMNTFSPNWNLRPIDQFDQLKLILIHNNSIIFNALYSPLKTFKVLPEMPSITDKEFKSTPVFNGGTFVGCVRDYEGPKYLAATRRNRKNKVIYYYMYSLKEDHRRLRQMMQIARLGRENSIKVIFYITPIDWESCGRLVEGFSERLRENTAVVCTVLSREKFDVVDMAFEIKAENFCWGSYPNEHLDDFGRDYVAGRIARRIREELESGE